MATLIAPEQHSPVADAETIRNAVQGLETNEKTIISIIGKRNAVQRKLIKYAYEEIYQEDLVKRLELELTGEFERAVYRWMLEPADRDAVLANVAIRQSTSVHRVIIEISCIYSPEELLAVKRAYQARYKHSMEEDLAAITSGDLRQLLVALAGTYRYDGDEVNANLANLEAKVLHNAIKKEVIDQDEIIRIISTRSKAQLKATFYRYKFNYGASITKHLVDDPANQYIAAVHTVLQCINDPKKYYYKALRGALNKPWIDEDVLTRVIVMRAEKDLKEIKERCSEFESLDHAVAKVTSGDYKAFLLTLLGNQD